jgi:nucleoside-diphosphate-sugar epimerase
MRLALDHHYSTHIAIRLRERGHDVVAAVERGWEAEDDEALLALCETDGRALVTNNVADFMVIARRWATQGRCHAGLVFTSDASMPRSRDTIGRYVEALDALLEAHPAENSFVDRVHWLTGAPPDAIGSARQHGR